MAPSRDLDHHPPSPEFSRPVNVARITVSPSRYALEATEAERSALAQRFGLVSLLNLSADVSLRRLRGSLFELTASLEATVVQECTFLLEPFEAMVTDRFTLRYRPITDPNLPPVDELDDIEFLTGDVIDIGEAVAQQLSLVIDPYPRSPGARLDIPV